MSGCLQGKRLYFCNYVKKKGPQLWQRSKFKKTRTRESKIIKAKPKEPSSHQKKVKSPAYTLPQGPSN